MNLKLEYPGCVKVQAISNRLDMIGANITADIAFELFEELNAAWSLGLDFEATGQAVNLFSRLAAAAADQAPTAPGKAAQIYSRNIERMLQSWRSIREPLIPMIAPQDQISAWQAVDSLLAAVIRANFHEAMINQGFQYLAKAVYPASATATVLTRRLLTLGVIDKRLIGLVQFLNENARFPQELALARATASRLDFQLAQAASKRTGAALEALRRLHIVDEAVTDTFGSDLFVCVIEGGNREAADLLTRQVLAAKSEWNTSDPYVSNYVEYILGRIDAGAGDRDNAMRVFSQLIKAGFAPLDSSLYLAHLAICQGRNAQAAAAIEALVQTSAIPVEFADAFSGVANAYRRAGGDKDKLARLFPTEQLVVTCRANRDRIDSEFKTAAENNRSAAIDAFWKNRTYTLVSGVGKVLEAADFDFAAAGKGPGRTIKLQQNLLLQSCIDQIPEMSPIARQTFFEAGQTGVPASEVIAQVTELTRDISGDFEQLSKLLPGWAQSSSVARNRLDQAMATQTMSAVEAILIQYLNLPGIPSELLAMLYGSASIKADKPASRERMLQIGVRYWKAARGHAAGRILAIIRAAAFKILDDSSVKAGWFTALEAVLDTMPDDDTRRELADWFLKCSVQNDSDRIELAVGRLISQRLGPPFDDSVRAHLRALVTSGARQLDATESAAVCTTRIDWLFEWCAGDPGADHMVADWFMQWVQVQGQDELAETVEVVDVAFHAINRMTDQESIQRLAVVALEILKSRLGEHASDRKYTEALLSRMESLSSLIPEISGLIEAHRLVQKDSQLVFFAAVLGGAAVVAVALLLLYFYGG